MAEAKDRFGNLPKVVERLIQVALIRAKAHKAEITHIRYTDGWVQYIIRDKAPVRVESINGFVKKYKGNMRLVNAKESGFAVKTSSIIQENMLSSIEKVIEDIDSSLIVHPEPKKS